MVLKSIALFVLAALLEIGGAWLVWQGVREHRGLAWIGAGVVALGAYGFVAAFQPDPHFGRVLAAYGGVFIAGSLLWGMVADGFRPDRWDVTGAVVALVGVGADHVRAALSARELANREPRGVSPSDTHSLRAELQRRTAGCGSIPPSRRRCGRRRW